MPGSMFIPPAAVATLPTSGAAWTRALAVAGADAGTPNLGNIDSIVQTKVLTQALVWARNGGGVGQAAIINKIKAAMGTESFTLQPLNPWRQIGAWIAAADLVDMPGSTVGANGQTFNAWVQSLADKVVPGQTNWNTLRKCSRDSGNNWGSYARGSLIAVAIWLKNHGLNASNGQSGPALLTEVINYFRRWTGDTSVPNTFTASGAFSSGWAVTSYPGSQGVINPVTSDGKSGHNCEDASRGSSGPPLTGAGTSYSMEALDGALMASILAYNAGYADAWTWGNSGVKRNGAAIGSSNFSASNHIYHHEPAVLNWVYGLSLTIPAQDSYGGRAVPFCTDWLASSGSTWLKGGGSDPDPVIAPTVHFTLPTSAVSGVPVTANATTTETGSGTITGYRFTWGDGTFTPSATGYQTSPIASHTYTATTPVVRQVTVTAAASDGATDDDVKSITVAPADGLPIAHITLSNSTGVAPLPVGYDMSASLDPNGDLITNYRIDWGDGIVTNTTSPTGTRTFATPVTQATPYTVRAYVTANAVESLAALANVTVQPAQTTENAVKLWMAFGGRKVPVLPPYSAAWDGPHPTFGTYHLWVDATGVLRMKNGQPASDTDGTPTGGGGGSSFTALPVGTTPPADTPPGLILFY